MSSAPENLPLQYYCYQCDDHVEIAPPPSPDSELVCPNCNGGFVELSDAVPPPLTNATSPLPDFFYYDNAPTAGGGFPFAFPSSAAAGIEDLFGGGTGSRSSGNDNDNDEFNPVVFLGNYLSNLQARGANIELIFESRGGGSGGIGGGLDEGGGEFRLPANLGDYFVGPGLEQLIQQLAENDPNRYGTPPAAKSVVSGLPDVKITDEMLGSDSSQCAVCKDSFELDEVAKQIPCNHIYHKDCILPWLELHNSCPVCRYELPTDDQDYESQKTGGRVSGNSSTGISRNSSVGLGAAVGGNANGSDSNSGSGQQTPTLVERQFSISLPWLLRGLGASGEASGSGGEGSRSNDASNNNNSGNGGARDTGSGGGQA